eukprot:Hpha_TRINITY_DN13967_c0_g1::TRINITY_DN13967_c0_g1_i1::g.35385::m.35385/K14802/DRS2, ATP8A; phospholipid-transporting ATPase
MGEADVGLLSFNVPPTSPKGSPRPYSADQREHPQTPAVHIIAPDGSSDGPPEMSVDNSDNASDLSGTFGNPSFGSTTGSRRARHGRKVQLPDDPSQPPTPGSPIDNLKLTASGGGHPRLCKSLLDTLEGPVGRRRSRSRRSVMSHISFAEAPNTEGGKGDSVTGLENIRRTIHAGDTEKNDPTSNFLVTSHYTLLNFLPRNLLEQFRQISNCYFLANMIIALIPGVSPITPITAVFPMILVLTIAAVKDGWEDIQRHRADAKDNNVPVTILRDGKWKEIPSAETRVGDFIKLHRGDAVKADFIVLASADDDSIVYVETSQLDGETNIKPRKGRHGTEHLNSEEALMSVIGKVSVEVDQPNDKLYRWQGALNIAGEDPQPLNVKQAIWRGSSVRKTAWAIGLVVYTGMQTKQGMNLKKKGRKMSNLVKKLNLLILIIFGIKNILIFLICGLSVGWADSATGHWYVRYWVEHFSSVERFFLNYLTLFILFSFLIPISLFVTVEFCKGMQIMLMRWDHEMYRWIPDQEIWHTCRPRTSDLNEQLGSIRYIFSDKTGTLTENIMRYVQGVVVGVHRQDTREMIDHVEVSGEHATPGNMKISAGGTAADKLWSGDLLDETGGSGGQVARFVACISLCHNVVPFEQGGGWTFEGASPDEVALVRCAGENGFLLTQRTSKNAVIEVNGTKHNFDVLEELEFTPTRKMMSVVVRDGRKQIFVLTKGADSSVLTNLAKGELSEKDSVLLNTKLSGYGKLGLRTLVVAWRHISTEMFQDWHKRFVALQSSTIRTDEAVDQLCLELEANLTLAGVAAYEDKLQDGVPETIRFFVNAGVVVWMLTGDKLETGIEIGRTCGLICPPSESHPSGGVLHLVELSKELAEDPTLKDTGDIDPAEKEARRKRQIGIIAAKMERALSLAAAGEKVTLAIDGLSLDLALHEDNLHIFAKCCKAIYSAVCCRLTPSQKAKIVDLFQTESGETALAIGDGANDATMIGVAKVGVGIIGLEGSQAELAADYAIPRFRHLKRLVAVHGRYALYRNAFCACFSFYKNLVLTVNQFYFAMYCGFSGTTVYDSWLLAVKNTLFTFLPPLFIGCFEKDIPEPTLEDPVSGPPLFRELAQGKYFDTNTIALWFGTAVLHGTVIFWTSFEVANSQQWDPDGGRVGDIHVTGLNLMSGVVFCVILKGMLHLRHITALHVGSAIVSALFYPFFLFTYSAIEPMGFDALIEESHFYRMAWETYFADPKSWLFLLLFSVGVVVPLDAAVVAFQRSFRPTLRDLWQRYDSRDDANKVRGSMQRLYDATHPKFDSAFTLRAPIFAPEASALCGCGAAKVHPSADP